MNVIVHKHIYQYIKMYLSKMAKQRVRLITWLAIIALAITLEIERDPMYCLTRVSFPFFYISLIISIWIENLNAMKKCLFQ